MHGTQQAIRIKRFGQQSHAALHGMLHQLHIVIAGDKQHFQFRMPRSQAVIPPGPLPAVDPSMRGSGIAA
jgi:hypothetical protein